VTRDYFLINEGIPIQYGPHTFTYNMANGDFDTSNDWTVATFTVSGA